MSAIPLDLLALVLSLLAGSLLLSRSWVAAVRRDRKRRRCAVRQWEDRSRDRAGAASADASVLEPGKAQPLDLATEARDALRRLDAMAARQGVRFDVAIQSGLQVHMPRLDLQRVLDDVLGQAIRQSPGGKVMIGGMRHGDRVQIAILDDGPGADRMRQESLLRDAMQCVALRGGTVEVNSRQGEGTRVVMRLPEPQAGMAPKKRPTNQEIASPRVIETGAGAAACAPALVANYAGVPPP